MVGSKQCEQCGASFDAERVSARFCSAVCRVKHHRASSPQGVEYWRARALQAEQRLQEVLKERGEEKQVTSPPPLEAVQTVQAPLAEPVRESYPAPPSTPPAITKTSKEPTPPPVPSGMDYLTRLLRKKHKPERGTW